MSSETTIDHLPLGSGAAGEKPWYLKYWVNMALIAISAIMLTFVASGFMSKGRPGTLTWGPTVDIDAIAIALNQIYVGDMNGLGRKETALAVAKYVTETGDEMNIGNNGELSADPKNVDEAIKFASRIYTPSLPPASLDSRVYITTYAEDMGFADFYYFAFKLFGFGAYSTHYLFLTLLFASSALFASGLWRSRPAMACLAFATTAFFLLTTSSLTFSDSTRSLAANRFVGTLILLPTLHILAFALDVRKPKTSELVAFILQAALFAFVVTLRSTAQWAVLGLAAVCAAVYISRAAMRYLLRKERSPGILYGLIDVSGTARLVCGIGLAIVLASSWQGWRNSQLNVVYREGDVLPHHLRWHSAFLGLTLHPEWVNELPFKELEGMWGDGLGWAVYDYRMARDFPNSARVSPVSGSYRFTLAEEFLKEQTLTFIKQHPLYTVQLYGFYKPRLAVSSVFMLLQGIPFFAWLLALPTLLLGSLAAIGDKLRREEQLAGIILVSGASFAPVIWAYPAPYVIGDQALASMFAIMASVALAASYASDRISLRLPARIWSRRREMQNVTT